MKKQSTPMMRMDPPTREAAAAEELLITLDERQLLRGTILMTPRVEGKGAMSRRDGFTLFQVGEPFTYVGWTSGKPGQLQFLAVAPGDYRIIYPYHGLGWISPYTVHVEAPNPDKPQDLGVIELPKLGSIALVLPEARASGAAHMAVPTRWTDLDVERVLSTGEGEVELAMFHGRAEVPGTLHVSPGQYVLRDPSRPDLPPKYINVRPGESAELVWH